jgi:hypothetical protein
MNQMDPIQSIMMNNHGPCVCYYGADLDMLGILTMKNNEKLGVCKIPKVPGHVVFPLGLFIGADVMEYDKNKSILANLGAQFDQSSNLFIPDIICIPKSNCPNLTSIPNCFYVKDNYSVMIKYSYAKKILGAINGMCECIIWGTQKSNVSWMSGTEHKSVYCVGKTMGEMPNASVFDIQGGTTSHEFCKLTVLINDLTK